MFGKIIKEGTWTYNESDLKVWITLHDIAYGTGDYEDPEEVQSDRKVPTYYLWFEPAGGGNPQVGAQFSSLEETLEHANNILKDQKPSWKMS